MSITSHLFNKLTYFNYPKVFGVESPNNEEARAEYLEKVHRVVFPMIESLITKYNDAPVGSNSVPFFYLDYSKEYSIIADICKSVFNLYVQSERGNTLQWTKYQITNKIPIAPHVTPPEEELQKVVVENSRPTILDLKEDFIPYPELGILKAFDSDRLLGEQSRTADMKLLLPNEDKSFYAHSVVLARYTTFFESFIESGVAFNRESPFPISEHAPLNACTLASFLNYIYNGAAPQLVDMQSMRELLITLSFLEVNTGLAEIKRLLARLFKGMDQAMQAQDLIPLLEDSIVHNIFELKELCSYRLGSFMGDQELAIGAITLALAKRDKDLLKAIASHVLRNDKPQLGLSVSNLVHLGEVAIVLNEDMALKVVLHALRKKLMQNQAEFDTVLPFAHQNVSQNLSTRELYDVCRYLARQYPQVLKGFIEANHLDGVRSLQPVHIAELAKEAEDLACKEVRMVAAKAMAEKVTAETYQAVFEFCKEHSITAEVWDECQSVIKNANKNALGRLSSKATKEAAITFIQDAANVESWERVGTGLLYLVKKGWAEASFFDQYADKKGNDQKIALAFQLKEADDNDSGAESE